MRSRMRRTLSFPTRASAIALAAIATLFHLAGAALAPSADATNNAAADEPSNPSGRRITIAAAVSLRGVVEGFAAGFRDRHPGAAVDTTYGASNALAGQIRFGAPIDLFLSADPDLIDDLADRGLISSGSRTPFASNHLVIVSSAGLDVEIREARDLATAEFRSIALPNRAVPLGRYARLWLAHHDLETAMTTRAIATEHARATLAAVELGHADLAIVYASDVTSTTRVRVVYRIPEEEQPPISYEAVRIARSGTHAKPSRSSSADLASLFLEELTGQAGANALLNAGLVPLHRAPANSPRPNAVPSR